MSYHTSSGYTRVGMPVAQPSQQVPADPLDIYTYLSSPCQPTNQTTWEGQHHIPRRGSTLPLIPEATPIGEAHNQTAMQPFVTAGSDDSTQPSSFAALAGMTAVGHAAQSPWSTTSQNLLTPQHPFFPTITAPYPPSSIVSNSNNINFDPPHQWRINYQHEANATTPIGPPLPQLPSQPQQIPSDMLAVQHLVTPSRSKGEFIKSGDRNETSFDHLAHFRTPTDHSPDANSINHLNPANELPILMSAGGGSHQMTESTMDPKFTWWNNQNITISDRVSANPPSLPQLLPQTHTANRVSNNKTASSPVKRGRRTSNGSHTTLLRKKRPAQLHLPPPTTNMRLPIPPTLHSAPPAPISLDLLTSSANRVTSDAAVAMQQPPKVEGWIKPEDRPVPPVGYVQPTPLVSMTPLDRQAGAPSTIDPSTFTTAPTTASARPRAVPRTWSAPQLRPSDNPVQTEYLITPGLNGLHVIPWQPYRRTEIQPPSASVSTPPAGPFLSLSVSIPTYTSGSTAPSSVLALSVDSTGSSSEEGPPSQPKPKPVQRRASGSKPNSISSSKPRRPSTDEESKERAICDICDLTLSRQSDLQRHMRKHTGEKPFQCPYCEATFARNDKLSNHIGRHHNGQPRLVFRGQKS